MLRRELDEQLLPRLVQQPRPRSATLWCSCWIVRPSCHCSRRGKASAGVADEAALQSSTPPDDEAQAADYRKALHETLSSRIGDAVQLAVNAVLKEFSEVAERVLSNSRMDAAAKLSVVELAERDGLGTGPALLQCDIDVADALVPSRIDAPKLPPDDAHDYYARHARRRSILLRPRSSSC